jgi:hypothetical protein
MTQFGVGQIVHLTDRLTFLNRGVYQRWVLARRGFRSSDCARLRRDAASGPFFFALEPTRMLP